MALARTLSIVFLSLLAAPAPRAAQVAVSGEAGITGQVLAPDGSPVTHGAVTLITSPISRVTAAIDRTGHFRIVPDAPGWQRLFISVPGLAPHRLHLTLPPSRIMALPEITLNDATYFRARFITAEGEPLAASGLRHRSIDRDGVVIPDPLDHVREQIEVDGSVTIGPLPAGRMLMAFDRAPMARTRLPDVDVTGTKPLIDGGVITIAPGGLWHVEVVDGEGKPVPRHDVWIEDAIRPSPLSLPMLRTDEQGRVVFDRMSSGRYRVWTRTMERCGSQLLVISRLVSASGSDDTRTRLVVGGRARFRITSPLGPVFGRPVYLSPAAPAEPPWQNRFVTLPGQPRQALMPSLTPSSCGAATDADGRFTMAPFPPGPSQLRVVLFNSTYIARVTVPEGGRETVITVPDGLLPVRVTRETSLQPLSGARVTWVGGGGRVEAVATANGEALLEAVGAVGGTLTISAREHQTLERTFDETPGTIQEVALTPLPSSRLTIRVIGGESGAVAGAVVELVARGPSGVAEFSAADSKGVVTFANVPPGDLEFTVRAQGFKAATLRVSEEDRNAIVVNLTRVP